MRFQIQKRQLPSGNPDDWAIFKFFYPRPNVIEVLANGVVVPGNAEVNGEFPDLADFTNVCGANNFYYENGTIEFVVNGMDNC